MAFATDARVTMGNDEWQGVSLQEAIEMDWEGGLYEASGFGKPVPMPAGIQLGFGSAVTTSIAELAALDTKRVTELDALRPPNRTTDAEKPITFHNRYVRVLGSRLKVWLSLRAATVLPVRATLDASLDLVIDLVERTSAGRARGMPAVICDANGQSPQDD